MDLSDFDANLIYIDSPTQAVLDETLSQTKQNNKHKQKSQHSQF